MKFCNKCDNMYYIGLKSDNQNEINHYCRHCGNIDETASDEGLCVLNTQFKKGEQQFNHIINEYTKLDPTLPRIYNVKCPNNECKTNKDDYGKPVEIIYMRYDDKNLKYLYICSVCDTTWKTNEQK